MFTVSVTIQDLGGDTPDEAAEVFWAVLNEYRSGALGPLFINVAGVKRSIPIDPTTGKVTRKGLTASEAERIGPATAPDSAPGGSEYPSWLDPMTGKDKDR